MTRVLLALFALAACQRPSAVPPPPDVAPAPAPSFTQVAGWPPLRWGMSVAEAQTALDGARLPHRYDELRAYYPAESKGPVGHATYPELFVTLGDGARAEARFDVHGKLESVSVESTPLPDRAAATARVDELVARLGPAHESDAAARRWIWRNDATVLVVFASEDAAAHAWRVSERWRRTE